MAEGGDELHNALIKVPTTCSQWVECLQKVTKVRFRFLGTAWQQCIVQELNFTVGV